MNLKKILLWAVGAPVAGLAGLVAVVHLDMYVLNPEKGAKWDLEYEIKQAAELEAEQAENERLAAISEAATQREQNIKQALSSPQKVETLAELQSLIPEGELVSLICVHNRLYLPAEFPQSQDSLILALVPQQ